ncbi:MAG TPA: hypothetical protein VM581_04900 [Magnetospirillaceae bacterium]|nr:hypothetical protein [Magnetospirillaceae bacterium]
MIHTPEAMSKDQRFALTEYLIGMLGRGLEFMDETEDGTPNTRAILLINPDYATIETWKDRQHAQHLLFAQAVASALELPPGSIPERVLVLPD